MRRFDLLALAACLMLAATVGVRAAPAPAEADRLFDTARAICERDGGRLWGRSLCGPMLLVDYRDKGVLANRPDPGGALHPSGRWFAGTLPDDVIIANTPTRWSSLLWTQIDAPLPDDQARLHVLVAHELFHRIQQELGLTRPEAGNRHLDTFDGRYLLQLEWRALARAMAATRDGERRAAIADALAFRRERARLFPRAAAEEAALEVAEGVPEYTGVMLGLATPAERARYALYDLSAFVRAPTYVRSFAYATGPAYGLLLDRYAPGWQSQLTNGRSFGQLLSAALPTGATDGATVAARARRYDDGALRTAETAREHARQTRLAALRARLIDGHVLVLPLAHTNYQFNPQTLVALDDVGTVYPTMRLLDDWGVLEVERDGALVTADRRRATVSATGAASTTGTGDGWTLRLKPGWIIAAGARPGDLAVVRAPASAP